MEVKGVDGVVRFDGQTVTIIRKGILARATIGKGEKSIPVASIRTPELAAWGSGLGSVGPSP